jgi:hypothetical protein
MNELDESPIQNQKRSKNIRRWLMGLGIISSLAFLSDGLYINIQHPAWYRILTSLVLLDLALFVSACLCLRNGLSQQIFSGRRNWFLLGCGLLSFLCGNIFFNLWEIVWSLNPAGSLGDPFFVMFYISLTVVLLATIVQKKIALEAHHWAFLVTISGSASLLVKTMIILIPTAIDPIDPVLLTPTSEKSAPDWVMAIDTALKPHANNLNYFYVWSDVVLICLAAAIVMGFWGMKSNRAWVLNAFAIICFYISDMWFAYAAIHIPNYQSGFFLEIFWTFGAILFGVAAANEYDFNVSLYESRSQH